MVMAMLMYFPSGTFNIDFGLKASAAEIIPSKPTEGDGSEGKPDQIGTKEEIYWFAALVNGTLTGVTQNKSANAVLTADITVNKNVLDEKGELNTENSTNITSWTPFGNVSNWYIGTFDGQNHTVSGLYFNENNTKNVGVKDSYFKGSLNVGGVCGYNYTNYGTATITNCYNTGNVSGNRCVGGVCGANEAYEEETTTIITNCYFDSEKYSGNAVGINAGTATDVEGKTTAQFNSGEVAYLLQSGQTPDKNGVTPEVWGQEIGKDLYPVLDSIKKVYQNVSYSGCEGIKGKPSYSYSNTQNAPVYAEHNMTEHPANAATCTEPGNYAYWTCSYENGVYYKDKDCTDTFANLAATVIPALEHEDIDNDGYCNNGCGQPVRPIVKEVSATLNGDIGLNYYIALPESITSDEGAYVQFTVNGQTTEVYLKDLTAEEDGTYKFTCWLTAKEMSDAVTFQLYDGNGALIDIYKNSGDKIEGASFEYSLAEYFDTLSSDESIDNEALKNIAYATLVYGAYAQNAFNHNANPSLDGSELATVTAETLESFKMTKSAEIPAGLKLTEMTFILETETTLRLYFKSENIENYTFKLDGTDVTLNKIEEESLYYVEIANISAKDLNTNHTLIINDECEFNFSALSYAYAALKTGKNDNLCNVVKALYKYNEAANAYFGK
ncbi:MAG: hypothetical protein MR434_06380 [Ruminococcus sp.]|nr:hypothetical protein [Ruminococcus sp.]